MKTVYWIVGIRAVLLLFWWMFGGCSSCGKLPSGATASAPATLNPTVATTAYGR